MSLALPQRFTRATGLLIAAVSLVSVALMLLARFTDTGLSVAHTVAVASTGFVLVALLGDRLQTSYGRRMTLALLACWTGDMMLGRNFVIGLAAFLLAHIGFIAAFRAQGSTLKRGRRALIPLAALAAALMLWLLPHVPARDILPVVAYILAIHLMVLTAVGLPPSPAARIALAGAVLFYISDIFVARWQYVSDSPLNALGCYPLYYTGCLLLAWTTHAYSSPSHSDS